VTEASLAQVINAIRPAIGDRDGGVVRTVHGYGYAFAAEIEAQPAARHSTRHPIYWLFYAAKDLGLPDGKHVIGRDPALAVCLDSPKVSRHHARATVSGESAILEDLGSKNGVFFRGERITDPTPLRSGDEIRIGSLTLVFRVVTRLQSTEAGRPARAQIARRNAFRHILHVRRPKAATLAAVARAACLPLVLTMYAAGIAHAQDDVQPRMQLWSKALGVECTHCHTDGNWPDASKPTFDFAQRMKRMVDGINAGPLRSVGSVTCWTCHRGRAIPARLPRESWQKIQTEHQAEFDGNANRGLAMSVYAASLGVTCSHCHEDQDRSANSKRPKGDGGGDGENLRRHPHLFRLAPAGHTVLHVPPGPHQPGKVALTHGPARHLRLPRPSHQDASSIGPQQPALDERGQYVHCARASGMEL
jgi:hypothetical protein